MTCEAHSSLEVSESVQKASFCLILQNIFVYRLFISTVHGQFKLSETISSTKFLKYRIYSCQAFVHVDLLSYTQAK